MNWTTKPMDDHANDLMVDLETLSTEPNAAIISIGAVKFNPNKICTHEELMQPGRTFYRNIMRSSAEAIGLDVSQSTLDWWAQQSDEAKAALIPDQVPIIQALREWGHWVTRAPRAGKIWAKGPGFDVVILRSAFKAANIQPFPIMFWDDRCVRTVEDMAYPNRHDKPLVRTGTHHNALDDSITQALMVQHCYAKLGLGITGQAA